MCLYVDKVHFVRFVSFVVVLPAYPIEIVKAKSRMLAELAGRAAQDVTGEVVLSLSIGGASYPADGADAEELLAEADRRMYKAKHAGTSGDLKRLERSLNTSLREHLDAVDSRRWHRIIANSRR